MARGRRSSMGLAILGLAIGLAATPDAGQAAKFTLVVEDDQDEGFNDPTPKAPVAGNPGGTLGEQRRNAFEAVAREWGARLASDVEIVIEADWVDLEEDCEPDSGPVAGAGPNFAFVDFPGAPSSTTWYVSAEADALAGEDLTIQEGRPDISAQFNSAIGTPGCLTSLAWDYRIGAGPAPRGKLSFVNTVVHELAHGLGFLPLVDLETGAKFRGRNDAFMRFMEDHSRGRLWSKLDNSQRLGSAADTGDLHWVGINTLSHARILAAGRGPESGHIRLYAPDELDTGSSASHFDVSLHANSNEVMEPFITRTQEILLADRVLQDIGWGVNFPAIRAIGDVNGNGGTDLAVLRMAENPGGHKVVVLDGQTQSVVHQVRIPAQLSAIDLQVIPHFGGSGADELAVLTWRARGKRIRVQVFDGGTGEELSTLAFRKGFPIALQVVPSIGGSSADDVVVLARSNAGAGRIWLKDPKSESLLTTVRLPSSLLPADLAVISDFAGSGAAEIALAVENLASGAPEVRSYDGRSGALLSSFSLDADFIPQFTTALPSFDSTDADEVAVVGMEKLSGTVKLVVVDASSGLRLMEKVVGSTLLPVDLGTLPDFAGAPADEIAFLARIPKSRKSKVFVVDASSGSTLQSFVLSSSNSPRALGILPSLGASRAAEVAVVTTVTRSGETRAIVRDARDGDQIFNAVVP